MPTIVRKATSADAAGVYELLRGSTLNNAALPFSARRRLFQPIWGGNEGYYGYLLESEEEVVGFLGMLFTERDTEAGRHKFCELHSWYVKDAYRNESMKLFLPVIGLKRVTLLNYTPTQPVYEISKKFGFEDLETTLLQICPVPTVRAVRRRYRISTDKPVVERELDSGDQAILRDHYDVDCTHMLVRHPARSGYLYLIVKTMRSGRFLRFGRIIYFSDPAYLAEALEYLALYLCGRYGWLSLIIDRDQLPDHTPGICTRSFAREVPSLYKSKVLTADQLRTQLYSEPLLVGYRLH
ncbi:hypothetical protein ACL02S_15260 [Nocardia sp. 004]|uniref:hypothetical protein n=1 Tax=Nocardia sp. 004 TaxID=3385978 RepID=UPI0039A3B69A